MEHEEFPKMLYFKGDAQNQKTVNNEAEEAALGDDWIDAPVDPLAPAPAPTPVAAKKK